MAAWAWSELGLMDDWHEQLLTATSAATANELRAATYGGRPFGAESFVETIERLAERALCKQRPGPERKPATQAARSACKGYCEAGPDLPGSPAQTYPSGTYVNYTYDAHGRAYGANTPSGPSYVNSTNYNAAGQIADRQLGNLLTEQNCFNDRFQPTVKRLGSGTSTNCANQAADSLHLAFDYGPMTGNNGNLKQQTITADPTHQWVQYYEYDEVNRLSIAAENAPLPANCTGFTGSWCREFDYDHFGNKATGSNRVMHQAKPTLLSQTDIATNRLTTATYDAAGNMTSHPVITPGGTITYDANNKKKTFTKTGLSVTTYYDANDRRVREDKTKGAVTTQTVWVYNAFGTLVAEYSDATPTVADGVYYRTTDHLGSTRIVTDDTGQVRQRRDFFPFGEEIPGDFNHGNRNALLDGGFVTYNASLSISQQFTGQQRDADTELDDFLARCFCAPIGKFTSVDPQGEGSNLTDPQSLNAYGYVMNRPLRFVDRNGKFPVDPYAFVPSPDPYDYDYLWGVYEDYGWSPNFTFNFPTVSLPTSSAVNPVLNPEGTVVKDSRYGINDVVRLVTEALGLAVAVDSSRRSDKSGDTAYRLLFVGECWRIRPGASQLTGPSRARVYQVVGPNGAPFIGSSDPIREQNTILNEGGVLNSANGSFPLNTVAHPTIPGLRVGSAFIDTIGGNNVVNQVQSFYAIGPGGGYQRILIEDGTLTGRGANHILQGPSGVIVNDDNGAGLPDCPASYSQFE